MDECPCGNSTIKLYKGSESDEHHTISNKLEIFLKGSNKQKELLQKESPDLVSHFKMIWDIRTRHMVQGLPSSYIFFLRCCYQPECNHPVCQSGQPASPLCWYPSGHPISHLPLPIPDSTRPWGSQTCSTCKDFCAGHYSIQFVDTNDPAALKCITMPPSIALKQKFSQQLAKGVCQATDEFVEDAAKSVLLSVEETKIWIDHLTTVVQNRKRGAAKAAATRQMKRQAQQKHQQSTSESEQQREGRQQSITQSAAQKRVSSHYQHKDYYCGTFGKEYNSSLDFWIACDICDVWYCCECEGLATEPTSEMYFCKQCCK